MLPTWLAGCGLPFSFEFELSLRELRAAALWMGRKKSSERRLCYLVWCSSAHTVDQNARRGRGGKEGRERMAFGQ